MDLSEQAAQHLLERIYDAAEFPDRWRAVYEGFRDALGVASIHVLGIDKRHGTLSYSDGANLPLDGELAYIQHYRFLDSSTPVLLERPLGCWTHRHEVISKEAAAHDPFFQEFLLPHDRPYSSGIKLVDTPDATVVFSALTTSAEGPLTAEQIAFIDRLLPHLRRACRIGLKNFVYSAQALVGHMLVNRLRQPVLLMSPEGGVIHTNAALKDLLRRTPVTGVRDGKLVLPQPHLDQLLRECAELEQEAKAVPAYTGAAGDAEPAFRSLRIPTTGGRDPLYAFFSLLTPRAALGTFGLRPVVMLVFYHPASAPAIDADLLHAVFGLSPAEARIASLLAEGLSLKEIASAQGTQHETVRKQLRSIYLKTSTNRQPDLVRLLLHLPHMAVQD
jgi:DNA-binding CsgD family transcriptional regulator